MVRFGIATYNVRGLRDPMKQRKIFNMLHHAPHDIIMLQETHSSKSIEKIWRTEWGGHAIFSHGLTNSRGVAILIKRTIGLDIGNVSRDTNGRIIAIQLMIQKHKFNLINCYAPNEDSPEFFEEVFKYYTEQDNCQNIIAGDFNTILSDKDMQGGTGNLHPNSTRMINTLMDTFGLIDIWRIRNASQFKYSWRRQSPPVYKRLDYIIIPFELQQHVMKTDIKPAFCSDHAIPTIEINKNGSVRQGPGYWKLNVAHLQDENYVKQMSQLIKECCMQYHDPIIRWEMIKLTTRGETIQFGARKKKAQNYKLEALNRKLEQILSNQNKLPLQNKKVLENQISLITKDIEEIVQYRTKGAMIRSKQQWFEGGEKLTKYFFNLEKSKAKKKVIVKLQDKNDQIKVDREEVLKEIHDYYQELFTEQSIQPDSSYLEDIKLPTVTPEDKLMLNAPISLPEIKIAIAQLKVGKCPGIDGLPIEWYNKFQADIATSLHSVILKDVELGKMHGSSRESITTLMEKQTKNSLLITNWRPLSLLNCDYKIYAKVLANRLQMVTPYLISEDQVGFMRNRRLAENIIELNMIIDYCQQQNTPAMILAIDFRKAFDTINWDAMKMILHKYELGENFIKMLMVCFNEFKTRIINNGYMTEYIDIQQGTKQGCPVSSIVFLLIIETIALKLKANVNIKGIKIGGITKIVSQFADDLWTATKYDKQSYKAQLKEFQEFQMYTGLSINYDKTEILRIGSLRNTQAKFYSTLPIKWSDGPIRILGIMISNQTEYTKKLNYEIAIKKSEGILKTWNNRSLTLFGKTQLINALVMPQFLFRIQCLPSPDKQTLIKYRTMVNQFIWNGKKPKISYEKLILPIDKGGIKLIDLAKKDQSLKISLLLRLLNKQPDNFILAALQHFVDIPNNLITKVNCSAKDVCKIVSNDFMRDLLLAWAKINCQQPRHNQDLADQCPWYNSFIKANGKMLTNKKLIEREVVKLQQLYDKNSATWYTFDQFIQKYPNSINFLDYYTLIQNIPREWLKIQRLQGGNTQRFTERIMKIDKVSKAVYDWLIIQKIPKMTARVRWEHKLAMEITDNVWQAMLKDVFALTNCTKLRWFQFRLLNHTLVTNVKRAKWNTTKTISPLCYYCQKENETVIHLLSQCDIVKKTIWTPLQKWLDYFCYIEFDPTPEVILLNRYKDSCMNMVNTIILITKQYIYSTKCLQNTLSFRNLITKISQYKTMEEIVAKKSNKLNVHNRKWYLYDLL